MVASRDKWGSKFGFIMAAAGSAVGLGNIWRFPYVAGQNGGGAFVFVYVLCVILIGAPLLFNEMALGRHTGKNPIGAFRDTGSNNFFTITGAILSLLISFFVLSYYGVIAGWTIGYIYSQLAGIRLDFDVFMANGPLNIGLFAIFMLITILIVRGGISGGIEKAVKILMPLLFVLVGAVIVRSLTLDGAMAGVEYYLIPDFSKINGRVVLSALGQAFFSLSVGWGIMITYGSYLPKKENIVSSGLWVAFMDTGVALLGGLMIFPAVFAFSKMPDQGPTLVFKVLPEVFNSIPSGGGIIGAIFFLLLCIAALTSSISMLEVPASYFIDEKKWSRNKASWVVGLLVFLVGIPSSISNGAVDSLTNMRITVFETELVGFFNWMDYFFGTFFIVIVALMTSIYTGWMIKVSIMIQEIGEGGPGNWQKPLIGSLTAAKIWAFFIRYICPAIILMVLLNMMGLF